MESSTTGTRLLVSVRMTFLLFLLVDGRQGEGLGIPAPQPGCHHVPVIIQPKFQQSFLIMFLKVPQILIKPSCFHRRSFWVLLIRCTWFDSGYMFCDSTLVTLERIFYVS